MKALTAALACEDLAISMGDAGSLRALAWRARVHSLHLDVVQHRSGDLLPDVDVLLIAGLDESGLGALHDALAAGGLPDRLTCDARAQILAVNAGFQVLLDTFEDETGRARDGFGLIPGSAVRGDLVEGVFVGRPLLADVPGDVSGFEAHYGRVRLHDGRHSGGTDAGERDAARAPGTPLCTVLAGVGNGTGDCDGYVSERVLATFVHGPVLARNPALADHLLRRLVPGLPFGPPAVWGERAREVRAREDLADRTGWGGDTYGKRLPIYSRLPFPERS